MTNPSSRGIVDNRNSCKQRKSKSHSLVVRPYVYKQGQVTLFMFHAEETASFQVHMILEDKDLWRHTVCWQHSVQSNTKPARSYVRFD